MTTESKLPLIAAAGAILVLIIVTFVTAVSSGSVAVIAGSALFGQVLKTILALGVLAVVLTRFMKWSGGGSPWLWLGTAAISYILTPASWAGAMLFSRGVGIPDALAWVSDLVIWLAVAGLVISRVLPHVTRDDLTHLR